MEEFEKINQSLDNLKTSSEISETLLGQLLDQNTKIEELIKKKDSEEFKLSDFKIQLKKLRESVNRNDLLCKKLDDLLKKVDVIKPIDNVITNSHIMEVLGSMKRRTPIANVKAESKRSITIFGGDNSMLNYKKITIGIYVLFFFYLGITYLPNYFLEKQQLDENYQVLKVFAEAHEIKEFYEQGNTDYYDKEIEAIRDKEVAYVMNYNKMKNYWRKEHEKLELSKKIEQQQEKLKQLER